MSRPFSYNDENFTVIGNVLFFHVKTNGVMNDTNIVEIPPAIYRRLIQRSAFASISREFNFNGNDSYKLNIYVCEEKGKYYLRSATVINSSFFITAFMFLKDI